MIPRPGTLNNIINQRFSTQNAVVEQLTNGCLVDAALLAESLTSIDEKLQALSWGPGAIPGDRLPAPEGVAISLADRRGRRWSITQHFSSEYIRLAPQQAGQPALIPGIAATSRSVESIEEQLEAGRGWYNAFPWPESPAEAWFSVQGTIRAAEITLAVPEPIEADSEEAHVFLVRRSTAAPEVSGFRHRKIQLRADKGGPTAHWRMLCDVEGFRAVPGADRRDLRIALLEIARLFPIERPSLLVPVEDVHTIGTPDPEAYLSCLNETDLLNAIWRSVR